MQRKPLVHLASNIVFTTRKHIQAAGFWIGLGNSKSLYIYIEESILLSYTPVEGRIVKFRCKDKMLCFVT